MENIVETRSGSTKLACGIQDPKRRAWCVLPPGHEGKHADSWGKKFTGPVVGRLADLPRYLAADGSGTGRIIGEIIAEEIAKYNSAAELLGAVLHQLEHGEASDFIDSDYRENVMRSSRNDLRWCRDQIKQAFHLLSPEPKVP